MYERRISPAAASTPAAHPPPQTPPPPAPVEVVMAALAWASVRTCADMRHCAGSTLNLLASLPPGSLSATIYLAMVG